MEHLLGAHGVARISGDMVDGDLDDVLGEEQQGFGALDEHRQQSLHLRFIVMTLADLTANRLQRQRKMRKGIFALTENKYDRIMVVTESG